MSMTSEVKNLFSLRPLRLSVSFEMQLLCFAWKVIVVAMNETSKGVYMVMTQLIVGVQILNDAIGDFFSILLYQESISNS